MTPRELNLFKPGKYILKKLLLYTETKVYDISNIFLELNIFEDLFSFSYSGTLVLLDSSNIIGNEKVMGGEKLEFQIEVMTSVNGSLEKLEVSLSPIIYKVTSEEPITAGRSKAYVISFIAPEYFNNMKVKISRSFLKKPFHEIARFALNQLKSKSKMKIEPCRNMMERVVIPFWNPFKTVSWCAEKAVQTASRIGSSYSTFLFYQTIYNTEDIRQRDLTSYYHFVSIDSLLQKEPKLTILFGVKDTYDFKQDPNKFLTAESFHVIDNFDLIKLGIEGAFNSSLIEYSFKNKTWKKRLFSYKNEFRKSFNTIEQNPFFNTVNPIANDTSPQVTFMRSMDEMDNYFRPVRNSMLSFLNNYKISLLIPGNGILSVGDIIKFLKPSFESEETNIENSPDRTYSGKYLVTAVRHYFTPETYKMSIEAVKESIKGENE